MAKKVVKRKIKKATPKEPIQPKVISKTWSPKNYIELPLAGKITLSDTENIQLQVMLEEFRAILSAVLFNDNKHIANEAVKQFKGTHLQTGIQKVVEIGIKTGPSYNQTKVELRLHFLAFLFHQSIFSPKSIDTVYLFSIRKKLLSSKDHVQPDQIKKLIRLLMEDFIIMKGANIDIQGEKSLQDIGISMEKGSLKEKAYNKELEQYKNSDLNLLKDYAYSPPATKSSKEELIVKKAEPLKNEPSKVEKVILKIKNQRNKLDNNSKSLQMGITQTEQNKKHCINSTSNHLDQKNNEVMKIQEFIQKTSPFDKPFTFNSVTKVSGDKKLPDPFQFSKESVIKDDNDSNPSITGKAKSFTELFSSLTMGSSIVEQQLNAAKHDLEVSYSEKSKDFPYLQRFLGKEPAPCTQPPSQKTVVTSTHPISPEVRESLNRKFGALTFKELREFSSKMEFMKNNFYKKTLFVSNEEQSRKNFQNRIDSMNEKTIETMLQKAHLTYEELLLIFKKKLDYLMAKDLKEVDNLKCTDIKIPHSDKCINSNLYKLFGEGTAHSHFHYFTHKILSDLPLQIQKDYLYFDYFMVNAIFESNSLLSFQIAFYCCTPEEFCLFLDQTLKYIAPLNCCISLNWEFGFIQLGIEESLRRRGVEPLNTMTEKDWNLIQKSTHPHDFNLWEVMLKRNSEDPTLTDEMQSSAGKALKMIQTRDLDAEIAAMKNKESIRAPILKDLDTGKVLNLHLNMRAETPRNDEAIPQDNHNSKKQSGPWYNKIFANLKSNNSPPVVATIKDTCPKAQFAFDSVINLFSKSPERAPTAKIKSDSNLPILKSESYNENHDLLKQICMLDVDNQHGCETETRNNQITVFTEKLVHKENTQIIPQITNTSKISKLNSPLKKALQQTELEQQYISNQKVVSALPLDIHKAKPLEQDLNKQIDSNNNNILLLEKELLTSEHHKNFNSSVLEDQQSKIDEAVKIFNEFLQKPAHISPSTLDQQKILEAVKICNKLQEKPSHISPSETTTYLTETTTKTSKENLPIVSAKCYRSLLDSRKDNISFEFNRQSNQNVSCNKGEPFQFGTCKKNKEPDLVHKVNLDTLGYIDTILDLKTMKELDEHIEKMNIVTSDINAEVEQYLNMLK